MNTSKPAAAFVGENATQLRQESAHSRQKIAQMVMILLIPVFLWLVQGTMLARLMELPWLAAIGVGVGCAFMIYLVDRTLLTTTTMNRWLKFGRVSMALSIAVLGGIGWELILFNGDVERRIDRMQAHQRDSLNHSFERTEGMQEQKLVNDVGAKQARFDSLRRTYLAEIQGRGSKDGAGTGPISQGIFANLVQPAQAEVARAEAQLETYRKGREARQQTNRQQAKRDDGLELRLTLLHETVTSSLFPFITFCALSLLLLGLELFVLWSKPTLLKTALDVKREQEEARLKAIAATWSKTRHYVDPTLFSNVGST